ncbi:MAG: phosphatase PAP2 family protein [Acidobacteriota bacterium]
MAGGPFTPGVRVAASRDISPWVNRALALGALVAFDVQVRSAVHRWRGELGDDLSRWAKRPGDWQLVGPVAAGGSLLIGWMVDGGEGIEKGVAAIAGMVAGSAVSEGFNRVVGRGRPRWGDGALSFRPFSGHSSFPSGHAALAFSLAGALDAVTESRAAAAVGYGVAGLVGASRIYDDQHWLSDVVVAAVVSSAVARHVAGGVARGLRGGVTGSPAGGSARSPGGGVAGSPAGGSAGSRAGPPGRAEDRTGGPRLALLATPSRLGVRLTF